MSITLARPDRRLSRQQMSHWEIGDEFIEAAGVESGANDFTTLFDTCSPGRGKVHNTSQPKSSGDKEPQKWSTPLLVKLWQAPPPAYVKHKHIKQHTANTHSTLAKHSAHCIGTRVHNCKRFATLIAHSFLHVTAWHIYLNAATNLMMEAWYTEGGGQVHFAKGYKSSASLWFLLLDRRREQKFPSIPHKCM